MLSCIVGNKSINSFDYDEYKLREWSNKKILKCPECGERVIYCNGDYKIAYFKHEVNSECKGNKYYESMTEEHINGIKILYEWLSKNEKIKNLEVEKYIKNTKQRPDIYFEIDEERYCIEYQCSPISTQYNKRHELYEMEGINDIWILGSEKFNIHNKMKNNVKDIVALIDIKLKTIEIEINKSKNPLMYFSISDNKIYKLSKEGLKHIEGSFNRFFPSVLKTKYNFNLKRIGLDEIHFDELKAKDNDGLKTILKKSKNIINSVESHIVENNLHDEISFRYSLDNEMCPVYVIQKNDEWRYEYAIGCNEQTLACLMKYIDKIQQQKNLIKRKDEVLTFVKTLELDEGYRIGIDTWGDEYSVILYYRNSLATLLTNIKIGELDYIKNEIINKIDGYKNTKRFNCCEILEHIESMNLLFKTNFNKINKFYIPEIKDIYMKAEHEISFVLQISNIYQSKFIITKGNISINSDSIPVKENIKKRLSELISSKIREVRYCG